MDNIYYSYTKARKNFGKHVEFETSEAEVLMDVRPNVDMRSYFITRDPVSTEVDAMVPMSEHWVCDWP